MCTLKLGPSEVRPLKLVGERTAIIARARDLRDPSPPAPFAGCAGCHGPGETTGYATPIPTGTTRELTDWLSTDARRELLVQRVLKDRDMPPEGLSASELQRVREFLGGLSSPRSHR